MVVEAKGIYMQGGPPTWRITPGLVSKWLITMVSTVSLLSRVVGPLPNGRPFMAYKWG